MTVLTVNAVLLLNMLQPQQFHFLLAGAQTVYIQLTDDKYRGNAQYQYANADNQQQISGIRGEISKLIKYAPVYQNGHQQQLNAEENYRCLVIIPSQRLHFLALSNEQVYLLSVEYIRKQERNKELRQKTMKFR